MLLYSLCKYHHNTSAVAASVLVAVCQLTYIFDVQHTAFSFLQQHDKPRGEHVKTPQTPLIFGVLLYHGAVSDWTSWCTFRIHSAGRERKTNKPGSLPLLCCLWAHLLRFYFGIKCCLYEEYVVCLTISLILWKEQFWEEQKNAMNSFTRSLPPIYCEKVRTGNNNIACIFFTRAQLVFILSI